MLVKDENDNLVPLVDLSGRFLKGENVPELFSGKYIKNEYYNEGTAPRKILGCRTRDFVKNRKQSLQSREICSQLSALLEN